MASSDDHHNQSSELGERLSQPSTVIGSVVRNVEHGSLLEDHDGMWRRWIPAMLLLSIAGLITLWFYLQAPKTDGPGHPTGGLSEKQRAEKAFALFEQGNKTFGEAKGKLWENDDENGIEQALNGYLEAWRLLHGADFPDGNLVYDSSEARVKSRNLKLAIERCKSEL